VRLICVHTIPNFFVSTCLPAGRPKTTPARSFQAPTLIGCLVVKEQVLPNYHPPTPTNLPSGKPIKAAEKRNYEVFLGKCQIEPFPSPLTNRQHPTLNLSRPSPLTLRETPARCSNRGARL